MSDATKAAATLAVDGKNLELPRVPATEGNDGVDVSQLLKETGNVTFDIGFGNTAACESRITYIDGNEGLLRYRGYSIDELAKESNFLEVAYLLIYGELPDAETLEAVERRIKRHSILHEDFKAFFTAFPRNGPPMAVPQAGTAALATYYPHPLDPPAEDTRDMTTGPPTAAG